MNHLQLGQEGERLAGQYLKSKKHTILSQNYRFKRGEIDIISQFEEVLIATEVKTRQSRQYGNPTNVISRTKQRQIVQVMNAYISETNCCLEVRFDVITILLNQYEKEIEHIQEAFYPVL